MVGSESWMGKLDEKFCQDAAHAAPRGKQSECVERDQSSLSLRRDGPPLRAG